MPMIHLSRAIIRCVIIAVFSVFIFCCAFAKPLPSPQMPPLNSASNPPAGYYLPRLDFGAYKLNGSDAKSASLIEGFIPLYQTPRTVTFSDLRYYNKAHTPFEGNMAFGVRHLTLHHKLFGLYGSFDRFRSARKRYFSQTTIGGEFWWNRVFFGANGYIPIGTKRYDDDAKNLATLTPIGGNNYNILYFPGYERIMPGADALIGIDLTNNFRIFGGGYYFHQRDVGTMSGPKFRVNYTWYSTPHRRLFGVFDRIALEGQITHDQIRQTDWYAGIRFSINLGRNSSHALTRLEQHLVDTIRRDMNVIDVEYTDPTSHTLTNADGSNVVVFVPTTYAEFANTIDTMLLKTSTTLNADSVTPNIIAINGTLTANAGDDQSLSVDQDIEVNGGDHPFIGEDGRPYVVTVGDDGTIRINSDETFLTPEGSTTLDLDNMTFINTSTSAGTMLHLTGDYTGQTVIDDTTFQSNSAMEPIIKLEGGVAPIFDDATLSNTNTSSEAFLIDIATSETIVIDEGEVTLENSGSGGGIEVTGGALRIENETILENIGEPVIDLVNSSQSLIITNSSITNRGAGCIVKEENNATVTITSSTLAANGANATLDFAGTGDISITDTTISNTGRGDLLYHTGTAALTFGGTLTLTHPAGEGIVLASTDAQTQMLSNFTIDGTVSSNVFSLPSSSAETLTIQNATIANDSSGDLIHHANTSALALDNVTLNQTGSGDGIVLASTTTQIQTITTTIGGNVTSGALIALPISSEETLLLSGATLINTGAGNILAWASNTDVTINNGASLANTGSGNAILVESATGNLTVNGTSGTPVTLNASNGFALTTNGHDFGPIDIEYVQSNAPFDFELTHASATGSSISFTNNTLDLSSNPPTANAQGAKAVLSLVALYGDLVVDDLDNNTITVTDPGNTISGNLYGIYTAVNKTNTPTITFTNGIQDNNITLSSISADMTTYGLYFNDLSGSAHSSANITLSDSLDNNTISIDNKYGARAFSNDANLSITNDIINNNWTVQDSTLSTGITTTNYGLYNAGILTLVSGNFNANTITIQNHAGAAVAFGNIGDNAEFTLSAGNFGETGFGNSLSSIDPTTTDTNGSVHGLLNSGTIAIAGDFNSNTLLAETNILSYNFNAAFKNNKSISIIGDINDNTFKCHADKGGREVVAFRPAGQNAAVFLLSGDFNNNTLDSFSKAGAASGIFLKGHFQFNGNFNDNIFTIESQGYYSGPSVVFGIIRDGSSASSSIGGSISNTIDGNSFSLIRLGDPTRARAMAVGGISLYNIQNNNFDNAGDGTSTKINVTNATVYGATDAADLVTQQQNPGTGITVANVSDTGTTYIP